MKPTASFSNSTAFPGTWRSMVLIDHWSSVPHKPIKQDMKLVLCSEVPSWGGTILCQEEQQSQFLCASQFHSARVLLEEGARKLEKWVFQEAFVTPPNFLAKVVIPLLLIPSPQELCHLFSGDITFHFTLQHVHQRASYHSHWIQSSQVAKSPPIGKDPDARKDWGQEEKGATGWDGCMVGWMDWLNRHEFQLTPGDGEGQRSLPCCSPWSCKELDTTEQLNTNKNLLGSYQQLFFHIYPLLKPRHLLKLLSYQLAERESRLRWWDTNP